MNTHLIVDAVLLSLVIVALALGWMRCFWLAGRARVYWERSEEYRISGETLEKELDRLAGMVDALKDDLEMCSNNA